MLISESLGGVKENSLGATRAMASLATEGIGCWDWFGLISWLIRWSIAVEWSPTAVAPNWTREWESSKGGRTPTARQDRGKSLMTRNKKLFRSILIHMGFNKWNHIHYIRHDDTDSIIKSGIYWSYPGIWHLIYIQRLKINLLIPDLQLSWKLYSLALVALKIRSISRVSCGSRVPKPSLGWTSINCSMREGKQHKLLDFPIYSCYPISFMKSNPNSNIISCQNLFCDSVSMYLHSEMISVILSFNFLLKPEVGMCHIVWLYICCLWLHFSKHLRAPL